MNHVVEAAEADALQVVITDANQTVLHAKQSVKQDYAQNVSQTEPANRVLARRVLFAQPAATRLAAVEEHAKRAQISAALLGAPPMETAYKDQAVPQAHAIPVVTASAMKMVRNMTAM